MRGFRFQCETLTKRPQKAKGYAVLNAIFSEVDVGNGLVVQDYEREHCIGQSIFLLMVQGWLHFGIDRSRSSRVRDPQLECVLPLEFQELPPTCMIDSRGPQATTHQSLTSDDGRKLTFPYEIFCESTCIFLTGWSDVHAGNEGSGVNGQRNLA